MMNNRIAKELRRDAFIIATETFHKDTSIKVLSGGQYRWERYSPKAIYKALKRAYNTDTAPNY